MWAFVMLTAYLVQKGSPESRPLDEAAPQDRDPKLDADDPARPGRWGGGLARALYSHSLGAALLLLFLLSFILHLTNSTRLAEDEARMHGEAGIGLLQHLSDAAFWFESFQIGRASSSPPPS